MIIIDHRRNSPILVNETPTEYGIEIDIRTKGNELIVHHDPFEPGISLESILQVYNHKFLILNVKEEGLELRLLNLLQKYNIKRFFFLDQSFPFLLKTASSGENRCAVRFSQYESIDTALSLKGLVKWVWVDLFNGLFFSTNDIFKLKQAGFKCCLVSPELQGFPPTTIPNIKTELLSNHITLDAVCTKHPTLWNNN